MVEYNIIKLFLSDVSLYEKYHLSLKLDYIRLNYPVLHRLFNCLPADSVESLEANYLANYPVIKDSDRQTLVNVLDSIKSADASQENVIKYLETHLAQSFADKVSYIALEVAEGKRPYSDLDEAMAERSSALVIEEEEIEFVTTDIDELLDEEDLEGGLHWRLKCLNQSLGPLRKGNFGHIFARVETGKTAMWVSESTHMAQQVEKPILIFFNEEGGRDVVFRMYNAVCQMTYQEIAANPKKAKAIWEQKIGDRIKFIDKPNQVERRSIERIIERVDPSLLIIDNMDKVKGLSLIHI